MKIFPFLLWTLVGTVSLEIAAAEDSEARRIHVVVALCA